MMEKQELRHKIRQDKTNTQRPCIPHKNLSGGLVKPKEAHHSPPKSQRKVIAVPVLYLPEKPNKKQKNHPHKHPKKRIGPIY